MTKSGAGTWDLGRENSGMRGCRDKGTSGRGDAGTRGQGDAGTRMWDVGTQGHDKQTLDFCANCKVQFSVLLRKIHLFLTHERAEFNNSCNLIGYWSGRNFLLWTALKGGIRLVDLLS